MLNVQMNEATLLRVFAFIYFFLHFLNIDQSFVRIAGSCYHCYVYIHFSISPHILCLHVVCIYRVGRQFGWFSGDIDSTNLQCLLYWLVSPYILSRFFCMLYILRTNIILNRYTLGKKDRILPVTNPLYIIKLLSIPYTFEE